MNTVLSAVIYHSCTSLPLYQSAHDSYFSRSVYMIAACTVLTFHVMEFLTTIYSLRVVIGSLIGNRVWPKDSRQYQ